jgi:hypothetical protein
MTTNDDAQAPPQPAKAGPALKRLNVFVGTWNKEGQAYDGPFGSAAKVTAVETFEWLPGGLFLIHRLRGHLGDMEIACIEIIGYDASNQSYAVHSFYNDGNRKLWQAHERDGTWAFTGDWKIKGEMLKVRCTAIFDDAGNTMTAKWEYSRDGRSWQLFWDTTLTKVESRMVSPRNNG